MKTKAKKPNTKKAKKVKQPVVTETIFAPYHFTPEEVSGMNVNLREELDKIEELEGQLKSANQDFKLRIQNAKNDVKGLRTKLASGQESREAKVNVIFDAKRGKKQYFHQNGSKELIREEVMSAADWQLPLFKPAEDGKEQPAPKGATDVQTLVPAKDKKTKKPKGEPGKTNVGDVLDKASALTDAPKVPFDVDADRDHAKLTREFKKAANKAGWTDVQISTIHALLRECDTEAKMRDVLRPHVTELPAESEAR